jgi:F-type H+-transporting ATPase subunit b
MDQIIHTFGIDGRLIAIQVFNFILLLGGLSYFLYTPLLKMIDTRKKLIAQGVEDAKNAALSLQNATSEKDAILGKAVGEAGDIVKRGEDAAKREGAAIIAGAHEQSARIQSEAEKKALALAVSIKQKSEADVAKAALLAAEKILKERGV